MMIGDKRRINNQDRAASGPPEKGDRKMAYTLLRFGNETIPGSDVMNVLCTYDPDKKGGFAAALKAKAEAVKARIEEKDAARGEIEAVIAQIRAETGG